VIEPLPAPSADCALKLEIGGPNRSLLEGAVGRKIGAGMRPGCRRLDSGDLGRVGNSGSSDDSRSESGEEARLTTGGLHPAGLYTRNFEKGV